MQQNVDWRSREIINMVNKMSVNFPIVIRPTPFEGADTLRHVNLSGNGRHNTVSICLDNVDEQGPVIADVDVSGVVTYDCCW